jgi:hypothetical protein
MSDETFLRLQSSETTVCHMASRLLAAYISSGQLNAGNEEQLLEQSLVLAIKLAHKADRRIESDDENAGR